MTKTAINLTGKDCRHQDAFGPFDLFISGDTRVQGTTYACSHCNGSGHLIAYAHKKLELPKGIEVHKTVLKRSTNILCLNNGCYAKFHRQVAHIEDAIKARKKK